MNQEKPFSPPESPLPFPQLQEARDAQGEMPDNAFGALLAAHGQQIQAFLNGLKASGDTATGGNARPLVTSFVQQRNGAFDFYTKHYPDTAETLSTLQKEEDAFLRKLESAPLEDLSNIITAMQSPFSPILHPSPSPFPETTNPPEKKRDDARVREILSEMYRIIRDRTANYPNRDHLETDTFSLLTELSPYTIEGEGLRRDVQQAWEESMHLSGGPALVRNIWNVCPEEHKTDYIFIAALSAAGKCKDPALVGDIWNACPPEQRSYRLFQAALSAGGKCNDPALVGDIWNACPEEHKTDDIFIAALSAAGKCNDPDLFRNIWNACPPEQRRGHLFQTALHVAGESNDPDLVRDIWNASPEEHKTAESFTFALSAAENCKDPALVRNIWNACPEECKTDYIFIVALRAAEKCNDPVLVQEILGEHSKEQETARNSSTRSRFSSFLKNIASSLGLRFR